MYRVIGRPRAMQWRAVFFTAYATTVTWCLFVAGTAEATTGPANQNDLQLPSAPSSQALDSEYPKCDDVEKISHKEQCRQSLEHYREFVLERYNDSLLDYGRTLDRLSHRNERGHASGQISDDAYNDTLDAIRDEQAKSKKGGSYMNEYYRHRDTYKKDVDAAVAKENLWLKFCSVTLGPCKYE